MCGRQRCALPHCTSVRCGARARASQSPAAVIAQHASCPHASTRSAPAARSSTALWHHWQKSCAMGLTCGAADGRAASTHRLPMVRHALLWPISSLRLSPCCIVLHAACPPQSTANPLLCARAPLPIGSVGKCTHECWHLPRVCLPNPLCILVCHTAPSPFASTMALFQALGPCTCRAGCPMSPGSSSW